MLPAEPNLIIKYLLFRYLQNLIYPYYIQYYIRATNDESISLSPEKAEYEFYYYTVFPEITSNSDLVINEFYIQLRTATLGRSKILTSSFHYLRQRGTSSISKNYEFSEDILKKNMPSDVRKMANRISEILSSNYSRDEIRENICKGFSDYLNFFLGNTTLKFRFPKLYKVKIFLINFILHNLNIFYNNYKTLKNYLILRKIVKCSNNTKTLNIKTQLIDIFNFLKEKSD